MDPNVFRHALILTGPTGSGKSRLALQLAPHLKAEILAMDSMTLYRGMDIGTAKPTKEEQTQVRHHLIDVLDPWESASVAWWLERAAEAVRDIEGRGKQALFVGGTPLYLQALRQGLFAGPPADEELRQELEAEAKEKGKEALHHRLQQIDPATAARLHPNDLRRIIRALEVHALTGRTMSSWQTQWKKENQPEESDDRCLCLDLPREELYRRINDRVESMFEQGLLEEVRRLSRLERGLSRQARQALGYKELLDHFEGKISLEEARREIQTRSRNFAKRQLTWFRHLQGCRFVSVELTFARWGSRMNRAQG